MLKFYFRERTHLEIHQQNKFSSKSLKGPAGIALPQKWCILVCSFKCVCHVSRERNYLLTYRRQSQQQQQQPDWHTEWSSILLAPWVLTYNAFVHRDITLMFTTTPERNSWWPRCTDVAQCWQQHCWHISNCFYSFIGVYNSKLVILHVYLFMIASLKLSVVWL